MGSSIKKYLLAGLLTAIPLWITWLVIRFIFSLMTDMGMPLIEWGFSRIQPDHPALSAILQNSIFRGILMVVLLALTLYVLGFWVNKVIGRKVIRAFENILIKIPIIKTIYGGSKKIIESFQTKPDEAKKVVLINYPSPEMKTIGLLTRTMTDRVTGRPLAAVYVPTTPNPTSGFLEIVPFEDIVMTDWTVNEALSFIVSGGMIGPDEIQFSQSQDVPSSDKPSL